MKTPASETTEQHSREDLASAIVKISEILSSVKDRVMGALVGIPYTGIGLSDISHD